MAKNILIIDDEALVTKSLRKLLEKKGYNVTIAQSGKEALKLVQEKEFNLIISDVRMPELDGVETIKAIRDYVKEQGKKPIKEILITGYADEQKYKDAVDLKVAHYIYKPFDTEELVEAVEDNIGSA
ncbi:MAG: response regulator [Candidatus Omnitrophota bacterium]